MSHPARRGSVLKRFLFKMPFMISCEEVESFILAYLEGELSPSEKRRFELHLKVCRECRDYLAAYKRTLELTKAGMAAEEKPDLPEDLVRAIIASRD